MKKRLYSAWLALTGRLSIDMVRVANARADYQLSRANEAVKLYNEGEVGRKAASDALGNKVINDLKAQRRI